MILENLWVCFLVFPRPGALTSQNGWVPQPKSGLDLDISHQLCHKRNLQQGRQRPAKEFQILFKGLQLPNWINLPSAPEFTKCIKTRMGLCLWGGSHLLYGF